MALPYATTDQLYKFVQACLKLVPGSKNGGTFANKPGYHNRRDYLPPNDYSRVLPLDKKGPADKAAAFDWTFPEAQRGNFTKIAVFSARLLRSGRDPKDERGNYLREFYGNADRDYDVEGWDFQRVGAATSDSSHLWHIHFSFMRAYLNEPKAFDAVLSILKGESLLVWRARWAVKKVVAKVTKKPAPKPVPKAKFRVVTTKVPAGGSLSATAAKYGMSLAWVLQLNPQYKKNPNLVPAGAVVKVVVPNK